VLCVFFFSSRRRHTRSYGDWSSDVCSSDLARLGWRQVRHPGINRLAVLGVNSGGITGGAPLALAPRFLASLVGPFFSPFRARCEIGRASCRERVWVWGGGGVCKRVGKRYGE